MSFWGLVGFLSRLPGKPESPEQMARSVSLIPLAGLVIGLTLGTVGAVEFAFLPRAFAALALLLSIFAVKGILHIDGLADTVDALASQAPRSKRLEILKDPHIGTAGALAIVLFVTTLLLSLLEIPRHVPMETALGPLGSVWGRFPSGAFISVVVAELNATSSLVLALAIGRPHSGSVLARPFFERASPYTAVAALLFSGSLTLFLGGLLVSVTAVCALTTVLVVRRVGRSLGGIGGDTLGAVYTVSLAVALAMAALIPWASPI